MSERLPPLAVPLAPLDNDASVDDEPCPESVPVSARSEVAWADQVAEQVAALWEGRPGAIPFAQAVISARQKPPKRGG